MFVELSQDIKIFSYLELNSFIKCLLISSPLPMSQKNTTTFQPELVALEAAAQEIPITFLILDYAASWVSPSLVSLA